MSRSPGITLIVSDVHVSSLRIDVRHDAALSAIVMLRGQARARLDKQDDVRLSAQSGLNALYGDTVAMTGVHPAGQRLRSVNLRDGPEAADDEYTSEIIWKLMQSSAPRLRPGRPAICCYPLSICWNATGINLYAIWCVKAWAQLLARSSCATTRPCDPPRPDPADRQLLERVRERLHEAPGEAILWMTWRDWPA